MLFYKHVALASLMLVSPLAGMKPPSCKCTADSCRAAPELQRFVRGKFKLFFEKSRMVTASAPAQDAKQVFSSSVDPDHQISGIEIIRRTIQKICLAVRSSAKSDANLDPLIQFWDDPTCGMEKIDTILKQPKNKTVCQARTYILRAILPTVLLELKAEKEYLSDDKLTTNGIKICTFQPGTQGMEIDNGKVSMVYPDSQAARHKVMVGWTVREVMEGTSKVQTALGPDFYIGNDCDELDPLWNTKSCPTGPYKIVFEQTDCVTRKFMPGPTGMTIVDNIVTAVEGQAAAHGVELGWIIRQAGKNAFPQSKEIRDAVNECRDYQDPSGKDLVYSILFEDEVQDFTHVGLYQSQELGIEFEGNKVTKVERSGECWNQEVEVGWFIRRFEREEASGWPSTSSTIIPDCPQKLLEDVQEADEPYDIVFEIPVTMDIPIIFQPEEADGMETSMGYVSDVSSGGQAERQGVKVGWAVLKVDGKADFSHLWNPESPSKGPHKILFGKTSKTITFETDKITGMKIQGNRIKRVVEDGQAARLGVQEHWTIFKVGGELIVRGSGEDKNGLIQRELRRLKEHKCPKCTGNEKVANSAAGENRMCSICKEHTVDTDQMYECRTHGLLCSDCSKGEPYKIVFLTDTTRVVLED